MALNLSRLGLMYCCVRSAQPCVRRMTTLPAPEPIIVPKSADQLFKESKELLKLGGKNLKQAEKLIQNAADLGHVDAMYELAMHYFNEKFSRKDVDLHQIKNLLQSAAALGHAEAQFTLANEYRRARIHGITINLENSLRYCKMAASQGHAMAQYMLGIIYLAGELAPPDPGRAYENFRSAAFKDVSLAKCAAAVYLIKAPNRDQLETNPLLQARKWLAEALEDDYCTTIASAWLAHLDNIEDKISDSVK